MNLRVAENKSDSTSTDPKPEAHIIISGGFGILDPGLPEIEEAFQYRYREFVAGPPGYAAVTRCLLLCKEDFRGRTVFSAGLVPRISELLAVRGYSVTISDERAQKPSQIPDANVLDTCSELDREFLDAVAVHRLGQIEVSGFQAIVRRISQIVHLFPKGKVVVVAGTNRSAQALQWWLERELQQVVGRAGNRTVRINHRVVISTPKYLNKIDGRNVDIVIIPDVADVGDEGADCIARVTFDDARTYLFRKTGQNLGARTEMRCEAMAGRLIVRLAPERASVRVQICRAGSFPADDRNIGLGRKRARIWWNKARNDLIAHLADAFARDDRRALWESGLMLDASDCAWLDQLPKRHVQMLVESTEHAYEVHRRLPHWCIRECGHCSAPDPNEAAGTIVTLAAAYLHGTHPHVLIRADGGSSPLSVRGIPPRRQMMPEGRMYLVDLDDDLDAQSRRDLATRISQYQDAGWEVVDGSPQHSALPVGDQNEQPGIPAVVARTNPVTKPTKRSSAREKSHDRNRRTRSDATVSTAAGDLSATRVRAKPNKGGNRSPAGEIIRTHRL